MNLGGELDIYSGAALFNSVGGAVVQCNPVRKDIVGIEHLDEKQSFFIRGKPEGSIDFTYLCFKAGPIGNKWIEFNVCQGGLVVGHNPLFEELWSDDLDWVCFEGRNSKGSTLAETARLQEIFLDHLAFNTSSNTSHILDKKYSTLLTDEEKILRDALLALKQEISPVAKKTDAWTEINSLLIKIGDK